MNKKKKRKKDGQTDLAASRSAVGSVVQINSLPLKSESESIREGRPE